MWVRAEYSLDNIDITSSIKQVISQYGSDKTKTAMVWNY